MIDDIIVYRGILRKAVVEPARDGSLPDFHESILFTNDPEVVAREAAFVYLVAEDADVSAAAHGLRHLSAWCRVVCVSRICARRLARCSSITML